MAIKLYTSKSLYHFYREEDEKSFLCNEVGERQKFSEKAEKWDIQESWMDAPGYAFKAAYKFFSENLSPRELQNKALQEAIFS